MTYEAFLSWCIDTSREDRAEFVGELPMRLNALLNERQPRRVRRVSKSNLPKGSRKGALKLAMKSARNHLTRA
jgi:hypothetical protein